MHAAAAMRDVAEPRERMAYREPLFGSSDADSALRSDFVSILSWLLLYDRTRVILVIRK